MNNKLVYTILLVVFIILFIFGGTYAWFISSVNATNNVTTNAKNFQVIYTGDTALDGNLLMTSTRTNDYKRTVSVRVADDSVNAKLNLYINIEELTANLAVDGFKWEVYGYQNGKQVYSNSGNFSGKSATSGNNIVDLTDFNNHIYVINNVETTFDVYLWLDGNMVDETVLGSTFRGYIGAKTENFTGIIKNPVTVTFDANGGSMPNLIYGLGDIAETDAGGIKYSISNGVVTVTANQNDGSGYTTGRVYLEAGKTYVFNCDTDGVWGHQWVNDGDSVEAFLMLNGQYPGTYYQMLLEDANHKFTLNSQGFTPTVTGIYWLRFDANKAGETHQFWNISITEKSKQVTYGQSYGTLPTPTKEGYKFMGWNGVQLLENTDTLEGYRFYGTLDNTTTLNGSYSVRTYHAWHGIYIDLKQLYDEGKIKIGDTVNLSIYYMMNFIPTKNSNMTLFRANNSSSSGSKPVEASSIVPYNWYRVDFPITITDYSLTTTTARIESGYYVNDDQYYFGNNRQNFIWFARPQVQLGSTATGYEPYYITSATTVVQNKNHTLKAIWEPNS